MFCEKRCSLKFRKIHRKTLVPESLVLIKKGLRPETLLKKTLRRSYVLVNFAKHLFYRTTALKTWTKRSATGELTVICQTKWSWKSWTFLSATEVKNYFKEDPWNKPKMKRDFLLQIYQKELEDKSKAKDKVIQKRIQNPIKHLR